jgi:hypothetical protein
MAFVDLDALKDDLGITGSTHDAWLQRRVDGALARMSVYTGRYIGVLNTFIDAWRPERYEVNNRPYWPQDKGAQFTLRHYPVVSIFAAQDGIQAVTAATVFFDKTTGELIGYGNIASPSRFTMPTITYVAGWETLPADLYTVLLGIITPQWQQRANAAAGLTGAGSVSIQDVGDIDFSSGLSGTAFERAASDKVSDPLLGPYAGILDHYIDYRGKFNNVLWPLTSVSGEAAPIIGETPPPDPVEGQQWWNSEEGRLYIYYNDGASLQWVQADTVG